MNNRLCVIGVAFSAIVTSLVKDILNPIIGLAIGGVDFSNIFIALNGQHYESLDAAQKAGAPTVNIGLFINAIINFLIISFAIFWVVKTMSRMVRKEEPPAPGPTKTEVLLGEIRDLLATQPRPTVPPI
jgi:large conductance mechanosensitive channel